MSNDLATIPKVSEVIEAVLISGNLEPLKPAQRVEYYNAVCQSLSLNPLTVPFAYIQLNGKTVLYATKSCTEQIRRTRKISITSLSREIIDDLVIYTATATDGDGRVDTSTGAVTIAGKKGEDRANAIMKAETKAKRRVTLSLAGLGMLDESEISDIPEEQRATPLAPAQLAAPQENLKVSPAAAVEGTDARPQTGQTQKTLPAQEQKPAPEPPAAQQAAPQAAPITADVVQDTPKPVAATPLPAQPVEDAEFSDVPVATEVKPTPEALTGYYDRAKALTASLVEKGGLRPSAKLTAGIKVKNYILGRTKAANLTELSVTAWDAALTALEGDPTAAVKIIEEAK